MKIEEILDKNCIYLDKDLMNKDEVLIFLSEAMLKEEIIVNQKEYLDKVYYRESLSDTGLLDGIAIPHGISSTVLKPSIAFVRLKEGIEWGSIDNQKVKYVFLLAIPEHSSDNLHIKMISELACSLMKPEIAKQINMVKTATELLEILKKGGEIA